MSYSDEFKDLESVIYGFDQPTYGSTEIESGVRNDMDLCNNFVEEQTSSQPRQTVDDVPETEGLFVDTLSTISHYQYRPYDISAMPTIINTPGGPGFHSYSDLVEHSTIGNPYQTGYWSARPRHPPERMSFSTGLQDSSFRHPFELNPYQSGMQVADQTPIVEHRESYNNRNAQVLSSFPAVYTENSLPKRETSATISRRLDEITPEGEQNNFKRKRRDGNVNPDWVDTSRPKYTRRIPNVNARYRNALRDSRPEPSHPEGVRTLFQQLRSEIVPKKAYYKKKGANATESHPPVPSTAVTAIPETGGEASSSTTKRRSRQANSRRHILVETVRQTAPVEWDRFDNEYYSGDDNVSDGGIEARGKATDWKPPRMACRRCNKFKQPCDHAYPACSLCAKYGLRCRYRDDLTGRQIRPGQLEEVEIALHDALNEIKRLKECLDKLEKDQLRGDNHL